MVDLEAERLRRVGDVLIALRQRARLSQAELARRAGVTDRTVRRIECSQPANLQSYRAVGDTLGMPEDWYLRPERLLDGMRDGDHARRRLEDGIEMCLQSGRFGPEASDHLRAFADFAFDHGGESGPAEAFATGMRLQLRRAIERAESAPPPRQAERAAR